MHGDGGRFNAQDSLYTFSWNSVLAKGQTVQTEFLFTVVKKSDMLPGTLDEVMRLFVYILLTGETPLTNHLGKKIATTSAALAGGYRGCLMQAMGRLGILYRHIGFSTLRSCRQNVCLLPRQRIRSHPFVYRLFRPRCLA